MATFIKPFRDISPHEIVNLFALDQGTGNKGQFVKISIGWTNDDIISQDNPVGNTYTNTVSRRWSVPSRVTVTNSGDTAFGMLLYDVREVDENNEPLIFHPQKQAEMQAVLSGQPVPIMTRGLILYSGIAGNPAPGADVYTSQNGELHSSGNGATGSKVGVALGSKDSRGWVLVKVRL